MKREVIDESFEFLVSRDKIRFAIHLDQHADFAAGMDIRMDQPLIGFPSRLFLRRGQAFLPEVVHRFVDVVV